MYPATLRAWPPEERKPSPPTHPNGFVHQESPVSLSRPVSHSGFVTSFPGRSRQPRWVGRGRRKRVDSKPQQVASRLSTQGSQYCFARVSSPRVHVCVCACVMRVCACVHVYVCACMRVPARASLSLCLCPYLCLPTYLPVYFCPTEHLENTFYLVKWRTYQKKKKNTKPCYS